MLKTIKKSFLAVVLAVATLFALTSCVITGGGQTTTDPTLDAQAALSEFTEQVTFANTAEVTTSFNLPAAGKKGSYQIPITWTSSNEAVIAITDLVEGGTTSATHKKASVTRPAFDAEDVTVTLTAEFSLTYTKNDGTSATLKETKTYNFTVLKETSEIAGGTLADIKADAGKFYFVDNAVKPGSSSAKELAFPVEFDATVTAVLGADGAGQFTVNDGTAGIYVYSNKTTVSIGDKVHVKGDITVYYGTLQVGANIEVTVLGKSDQNIEFKPATPGSVNAMDTADGMYGGQTLNVSGTLLFGKYNNGSSDSFWLEDAQTGSQIELYYKSFTAAEKEALQAYAGKFVEMNVVTYDTYSSSAPNDHRVFAIPSTVKEATAPEVTDADKLAAAVAKANAASLKDVYYNGDAFAFPAIDVAEGVNIEWSIEPAAVLVDGKLVITAAGTATLKAVVTCGTLTETVTLTINLDVEVPALDTGDFEENTPYYIVATNGNGDLYFAGTIAEGRYGGKYTAAEAVKVYVEKADNGLYIYFLDGTTKTYIVMDDKSAGGSFTTDKANATIFEYNATIDTLVVAEDTNNRAFGVGATATFDTFSAYDITGTYNWGKFVKADGTTEPEQPAHTHTACPECGKCTAADCDGTDADKCAGHTPVEPEQPTWGVVTEFKENVAYKFGVVQGNLNNKLIYLTGNYKNTHYGESTDNIANAADVYVVAVDGGYNLKLVKTDGTVLYINVVPSGTYRNIKFQETASSVWTFDAELNTFVTDIEGTKYYVGTYNTFDTISPSSIDKAATSFVGHLYGQTTGGNTPVEPEVPAHEHTLCPECGKCTAADCDGADTDKCQGHTTEPETPEQPVVSGGRADLETMDPNISTGNGGYGQYDKTFTSTNGWTSVNSALQIGGATDVNPQFIFIGPDNTVKAIVINGKTSAKGVLTSPTLKGGISKLTFNYGHAFTDKNGVDINVTITDASGNKTVLNLLKTAAEVTQKTAYTAEFVLETPVLGDFTIEFTNNSPSQTDGNKDRVSLWNIEWVGATGSDAPVEPEQPAHTHTKCDVCGLCTAEDCDGTDADKCQGHEPEVPAHEHTACPTCGLCTAEDCDGAEEVKCQGHAPVVEPEQPEFTVTIAEFAEEFLADWNAIATSPASKTSFRADTSATIKEVFANAAFLAKYKWLFTYLNTELSAKNEGATSEYITDALRDLPLLENGDTAVILVSANTRTFIRVTLEALMNEAAPDAVNYAAYAPFSIDYTVTENQNVFLTAYQASLEVKPEEPEVPAHTHTACPTCGLCTAEDCDGAEEVKCQGHVVEPTYLTVAEVKALTSGATASVKGVVIAKGTESLLIQDETGAIMLYKANNQALFGETKVGDVVTAEGVYSPYKGLHEVANLTSLAIAETGTAPAVKELTAIDAATIESLQCQIVSIELTYVSGTVGAGQNATFKDANENNVTVRGDAKWGTVETMNLVPGTTVKVTAFVNWFNGAQLTNVSGYTFVEVLTVPAHEHTACPTCGLCTAEDCDGAEEVKCQGHVVEPENPESATEVKIDFATKFSTYAASWTNSYASKTLTSEQLGVEGANFSVGLSNVSKQTGTITNLPVLASKSSAAQYVTFTLNEGTISSITFN